MTKDKYSRTAPGSAGDAPGNEGKSTMSSRLGSLVSADLEAIHNDLKQAQLLAADYRWQLAGKSNECAELRQLLEKTQCDLVKLQNDVGELRRERHRLANEAMKAKAMDFLEEENATLRAEIEQLRSALQTALSVAARKPADQSPAGDPHFAPKIIELDFDA